MSASESWASSPLARKVMQGNRSRDTCPEMAVRRRLHAPGFRYRVSVRPEPKLRRTADIVVTKLKVAVFVDGCYWHGCPQHCRLTASNYEYWVEKIDKIRQRDAQTNAQLRSAGWMVLRYWEHVPSKMSSRRSLTRSNSERRNMRQHAPLIDRRLFGYCYACGDVLTEHARTIEHVPARALLNRPYPENLATVPSCFACNNGSSANEQFIARLLEAVRVGSPDSRLFERDRVRDSVQKSKAIAYRLNSTSASD